jgi:hypothetical protein
VLDAIQDGLKRLSLMKVYMFLMKVQVFANPATENYEPIRYARNKLKKATGPASPRLLIFATSSNAATETNALTN